MTNYILRRLLQAFLILGVISVSVFVLERTSGGDPALLQQGLNATPERIAAVHKQLGLDQPYPVQYLHWIKGVLTLNLGKSVLTQTSVTHEFKARFPVSFQLLLMTMFWTILMGIPLGVISAVRRNSIADYGSRMLAVTGLSMPTFWVATLVLLIPAQQWGYAPALNHTVSIFQNPMSNLRQLGPPSLVLAVGAMAGIMRLTRSELLEVLRADYIRTARAKGLGDQAVVIRHALRNSLIPVVTVLGLQISGLLGGSVIIETIFNLRGIGQYLYASILQKDFAVVQSLVMYTAGVAVLMNLAVDVLYAFLDPRIRYS